MATDGPGPDAEAGADVQPGSSSVEPSGTGLGPVLRQAWLGYQHRLDTAMADTGFGERRFPDGRVLRLCAAHNGSTISAIGRELGITRQGAGKVVEALRHSGYVTIADSPTSKREKSVTLTARGIDYLHAQRTAALAVETDVRAALGDAGYGALLAMLHTLDDGEGERMRTYLRRSTRT